MNIKTGLSLSIIALLVSACGGGVARLAVPDEVVNDPGNYGYSLNRNIPSIRTVSQELDVAIEIKPMKSDLEVGEEMRFMIGVQHNLPQPFVFSAENVSIGFTNDDGSRHNTYVLGYDDWAEHVQAKEGGSDLRAGLVGAKTALSIMNVFEGGSLEDSQYILDDAEVDMDQVRADDDHARATVIEQGQNYWSPTTVYPGQNDFQWGFISAGTYGGGITEVNLFVSLPNRSDPNRDVLLISFDVDKL